MKKRTGRSTAPRRRRSDARRGFPPETAEALVAQGRQVGIETRKRQFGEDVTALQELILYGLKGTAAYADHAYLLGQEDDGVYAFFHEALDFLTRDRYTLDELVGDGAESR